MFLRIFPVWQRRLVAAVIIRAAKEDVKRSRIQRKSVVYHVFGSNKLKTLTWENIFN